MQRDPITVQSFNESTEGSIPGDEKLLVLIGGTLFAVEYVSFTHEGVVLTPFSTPFIPGKV